MPTIETQSRYAKLKQKQRQQQHNLEWSKYYQDKIYLQNKKYYKQMHPLCEDCLKQDIIKSGEHVHHIRPFSEGQTEEQKFALLRDITNMIHLCKECHKNRHKERGDGMYKFTHYTSK